MMIIGRVGANPDLRITTSGKAVCNLSVAVTTGSKDNQTTFWSRWTAFEKTAEIAEKYVKKGHMVALTGTPRINKWTDKNGVEHNDTVYWVTQLTLLPNGPKPTSTEEEEVETPDVGETLPE